MGYQPLEKLLPQGGGSIYKLILVAAKRAAELADGAPKLIDFPSTNKTTTIALEEILAGRVTLKGTEVHNPQEKLKGKKKDEAKQQETDQKEETLVEK